MPGALAQSDGFDSILPGGSDAQGIQPYLEFRKQVDAAQRLAPLDTGLFGEQVSLYNGSTSFSVTDIDLPGNSDLPVAVTRRLPIENQPQTNASHDDRLRGFANWDMDLPYLAATYGADTGWSSNRCSGGSVPNISMGPNGRFLRAEVWQGIQINLPGRGETKLLGLATGVPKPTQGSFKYSTSDRDVIDCVSMKAGLAGEGYRLTTAGGVRYTFDVGVTRTAVPLETVFWSFENGGNSPAPFSYVYQRNKYYILASRIEDRFGNWVQYAYNADGHPTRIWSNDGRDIQLSYANGQLVSAVTNGRTWTYRYSTREGQAELKEVIQPDSSRWAYAYTGTLRPSAQGIDSLPMPPNCSGEQPGFDNTFELTASSPSGAIGRFSFSNVRHYRSGVHATECARSSFDPRYEAEPIYKLLVPHYFDVMSIESKVISGPGIAQPYMWTYDFRESPHETLWGSHTSPPQYPCTTCNRSKWVSIVRPDGSRERHEFGIAYRVNDGRALGSEVVDPQGGVLESTRLDYLSDAEVAQHGFFPQFGSLYGGIGDPSSVAVRPVKGKRIERGGTTFRRDYLNFDAFGRPLAWSSSSPSGAKREAVTYHDNLSRWVLSQPRRSISTDTNQVLSETEYDDLALPVRNFRLGKLQQTLSYHADGQLKSVADGRGNTTQLSAYRFGVPGRIVFADGAVQTAEIDANGWVSAVVDPTGAKTCYAHDSMGRTRSITYPSQSEPGVCDTSRWARVSISFEQSGVAASGLSAGHWRVQRREGDKQSTTLLDALWRPVVEDLVDASNPANTLSRSVTVFDHEGRTTFQSYPTRSTGDYRQVTAGTRTQFDALGRVTRSIQSSELGELETRTDYPDGLTIRVTKPNGLPVTMHHMAWDAPSYDLPVQVDYPEGKRVEIGRHPQHGWPLHVRQREAAGAVQVTRSYVYDGHGQLCKTIEPETGASVTGHDAAGNPTWQAAGLVGGTYSATHSCSHTEAWSSGRRVDRTYDTRNRPVALRFPDGRGDQVLSYEPDGLPREVTAYYSPNNADPATTRYTYNARRLPLSESLVRPGGWEWRIGYEYDAIGNLRWLAYPTGLTLDFKPNALGQATQAIDTQGRVYASGASYFANGALARFTYGNGIVYTMSQNARQFASRATSSGGVSDYGYAYDVSANVTAIQDLARGAAFDREMRYDGLDRLVSARSPAFGGTDFTHRFSYDALDNLRSWTQAGVKDYADYVYDANNRLSAIRSSAGATLATFAYDVQGNLRTKDGQNYGFDFGNRLRELPGREYYRYDAAGRRILAWSTTLGAIFSHYASSGQLLYQEDHRQAPVKASEHIHFAGSLIATRESLWGATSTIKFQHTDALGSPVAVTNASGQVLERMAYEPWGAVIGKPAHNGIGYTGHVMDGGTTGLTYMQQRYYDQSIGRFLSVDPVTIASSGDHRHFNRYAYAYNSPIKFLDPDGRSGCTGTNIKSLCNSGGGRDRGNRTADAAAEQSKVQKQSHFFISDWSDPTEKDPLGVVTVRAYRHDSLNSQPRHRRGDANPRMGQFSRLQAEYWVGQRVRNDFYMTTILHGSAASALGADTPFKALEILIELAMGDREFKATDIRRKGPFAAVVYAAFAWSQINHEINVPSDQELLEMRERGEW